MSDQKQAPEAAEITGAEAPEMPETEAAEAPEARIAALEAELAQARDQHLRTLADTLSAEELLGLDTQTGLPMASGSWRR